MADNGFVTENSIETIRVEAQENQITTNESTTNIVADDTAPLVSEIEEISAINITVGEVSGVSTGTRIVVDHNASNPNQHTIGAITGLREELDKIQALKTVYSDKSNIANYYKWKDTPYEHGRFVSLTSGDSTIEICGGSDIFGVSVEDAGFVGRQDATVPRGKSYGLIVTSGLVDVQCESSVKVGDYVVSNDRGYAKKSDSDYGYKVLEIENKDGIEYAVIMLGVQADVTNAIGVELGALTSRVGVNETNIVSAINLANQAYNKVQEIDTSNQAMSDKVDSALDVVDKIESDVEDLGLQVSNSALISAQAKAIAESAATSAESMRNEAVEKANEALVDTSALRKELEATVAEIDIDLENMVLELEETKESILATKSELNQSIDDTKKDLSETKEDIASLEEDLIPLATWPEDSDNPTGIAGFVAKADENSATIGSLVKWQGETNESISAFKQEVQENYATQTMLSAVDDNLTLFKQEVTDTYATQEMVTAVGDNLASFKQEVKDDYATQEMLTSVDNALTAYKQEVEKNYATQQMLSSVEDNLASYKQEVTDTYATQQMVTAVGDNLTSYKQEVTDTYATQEMVTKLEKDTSKALTDYKQEVEDEYATQEMVTKLEKDTSKALTDYKQEVTDTYATQESLTTLRTDTTNAIAASEEKATATYASKSDLTSFEGKTNVAMARIEQKADANGAYMQSTVANMGKYSVGPYSQSHNFKLDQAKSVLTVGMIYVPTETHTESLPASRTFTKQYYYTWDGEKWVTSSSVAVFHSNKYQDGTTNSPYWYIPGASNVTNDDVAYNSHTLYKWESYVDENKATQYHWVAVATLDGSSQSLAVSQIRQDANSIEAAVIGLNGEYAGIKSDLSGTQAAVQQLSKYANNGATIKTQANDSGSAVTIQSYTEADDGTITEQASLVLNVVKDADGNPTSALSIDANNINFEGFTTFARPDDIPKNTSQLVNDSGLAYADDIPTESDITTIVGGVVTTDYVNALGITATAIHADTVITVGNLPSEVAMSDDIPTESDITTITEKTIKTATIEAGQVNVKGDLNAFGATIGGWEIAENEISNGLIGISSSNDIEFPSLANNELSPLAIYSGHKETKVQQTFEIKSGFGGQDVFTIDTGLCFPYQVNPHSANFGVFTYAISDTVDASSGISEDVTGDMIYPYSKTFTLLLGAIEAIEITSVLPPAANVTYKKIDGGIEVNLSGNLKLPNSAVPVGCVVRYEYENAQLTYVCRDNSIVANASGFGEIRGNGEVTLSLTYSAYTFALLQDGSAYMGAIKMSGDMFANSGRIGNLAIENGLTGYNASDEPTFILDEHGFNISSSDAKIKVGNVSISQTSASGDCAIQTTSGVGIIFNSSSGTNATSIPVSIACACETDGYHNTYIRATTTTAPIYDLTFSIKCKAYDKYASGSTANYVEKTLVITIPTGETTSGDIWVTRGAKQYISIAQPSGAWTPEYSMIGKDDGTYYTILSPYHTYTQTTSNENIVVRGNVLPNTTSSDKISGYNLGGIDNKWNDIYGKNASVNTSDRSEKNSIEPMSEAYENIFDNLIPVTYKWNENTSNRTHTGLIAQDVKEAVENAGLTTQDFAGYCEWEKEDGSIGCGLRYGEFISLCIDQIQKLKKRVEELEDKLNTTQND